MTGTPSFLLGLADANGSVRAVKLIQGAQSYSVFQVLIDELLAASSADNSARQALTID